MVALGYQEKALAKILLIEVMILTDLSLLVSVFAIILINLINPFLPLSSGFIQTVSLLLFVAYLLLVGIQVLLSKLLGKSTAKSLLDAKKELPMATLVRGVTY